MRSVLLGGRTAPRISSPVAYGLFVWLPVAVMVAVIIRESTEAFSSLHTSRLFRPLWEAAFGRVSEEHWDEINHILRKSGHFLGYGTLGLTWLRAWLLTWLHPLRLQTAAAWRGWSLLMAICCTATIASMDELHQTFLASRTGMMQDVLLDTLGATVLCLLVSIFWLSGRKKSLTLASSR